MMCCWNKYGHDGLNDDWVNEQQFSRRRTIYMWQEARFIIIT